LPGGYTDEKEIVLKLKIILQKAEFDAADLKNKSEPHKLSFLF